MPLDDSGDCPSPPSPPTVDVHEFDIFRYLNPVYAAQGYFTNLLGLGAVAADELPFPDAVVAGEPGASSQDQTVQMNIDPGIGAAPMIVTGLEYSMAATR